MLQALVSWSIHNRVVVVVLAALVLVGGFYAAGHARLDVFPEFAPPEVVVQTEAPGLSPSEVEQLVTLPIEQVLNGVPALHVLRSQSIQGLSVLTVIFQDGTDIYRARQLVAERLAEVQGQLPERVKPPRMGPLTTSTGRLLIVGFTSETLSPLDLRDRIQWTVRPRILAVRGVAAVNLFGGEVRQLQVQVNPETLNAHNLTLTDVLEATRQATGVRGAGFQENANQRLLLRVEGQVVSADQLGETVVTSSEGTPVRLRDLAQVRDAGAPKFGDAAINGQPGVTLTVTRQYSGDTLEITQRVEAELEKLRPALEHEGITYHPGLFRQGDFIQRSISNVTESLLIGVVLVVVVLYFLFNLRTAFISLTAIPLSLLGAVFVLWAWGISLNTLTLGGLAIAVGEVVDDAIIDVENIFRRLRENAQLVQPRSLISVVLSASLEVRTAVVYATFIVVLVFVPIFFLTGLQGRLFAPLGYAYVLAVLVSLLVALTVTPALSLVLLPGAGGGEETRLLRWLQAGYEWLLRRLDRESLLVLAVMVVLVSASGWAPVSFGGEFLPELRENHYVIHMQGLPGTSLPQSMAAGKALAETLLEDKYYMQSVCQHAGRAELGEDTWGVEYSELEIGLTQQAAENAEQVEQKIKGLLKHNYPSFSFNVFSFLSERINETISGTIAPVSVKVYGDDLQAIDHAAEQIAEVLRTVRGNEGVRPEPQTGQPEVVIRVRPEDAARRGLRNVQLLDAVHAAYQGAVVAQTYDRNRVIDLVVILDPVLRNNPEAVADLWIATPPARETSSPHGGSPGESENRLQLKQLADVFLSDGRFLIKHEGGVRMCAVTCNVSGRDVESFVTEAQRRVAELTLPEGVTWTFAGEHEAKQTAQRELLLLGGAVLVGILLLLWLVFGSVRRLLLVLLNLPFALVGGVAVVYMMGGVLNVGALVGFVTLFGITMRNGIMMVSHWQHLHEVEGMAWGPELVFRGARERLAPVLMTALVTGLGLLPIAIGSGEAGREVEGPMALVILGGLVTSTALNLLVLPVFYRRFGN